MAENEYLLSFLPGQIPNQKLFIVLLIIFLVVKMNFCDCGATPILPHIKLLRENLFPATTDQPHTAATFRLLEAFDLLTYESKISAYEFYQSLARLTDNTMTPDVKVIRTYTGNLMPDLCLMLGPISRISPYESGVEVPQDAQASWAWPS